MTVLILHGILGSAGENWGQWLHDSLIAKSYEVIMPTLPKADHPDRCEWLEAIKRIVPKDTSQLIMVGHSLGVTSALDFIEQSPEPVKALLSVSGMAQDYGMELNSYFLKAKSVDFERVNANLRHASVFYGDNDPYVTQDALKSLARELQVQPVIINEGGHLNASAGFTTFPALLEAILAED